MLTMEIVVSDPSPAQTDERYVTRNTERLGSSIAPASFTARAGETWVSRGARRTRKEFRRTSDPA